MGNQNLTEKQKAVVDTLKSIKDEQIISLIQEFRENGDLFIVEPLIELLYSKRSHPLKEAIIDFISDIRNQDAAKIITSSLQKHLGDPNTAGLLSACWQSNLDFSDEIPLFIEILCSSDFQTSFDAFTVIENSTGSLSLKNIDLYITAIESRLKGLSTEKQSLLTETIVMLENFKRNGGES